MGSWPSGVSGFTANLEIKSGGYRKPISEPEWEEGQLVSVGLLRNCHIHDILEEGSTNPSNTLTGNVERLMVGVRVLAENLKPSGYHAEEQVGRTGQGSG